MEHLARERVRGLGRGRVVRELRLHQADRLPGQQHGAEIEDDILHAATGTTDTPWFARARVVRAPGASGRERSVETTNTGPSAVSKAYS